MAKDGTMRGGQRVGAGRKSKALTDKIADGRLNGAMVLPEPAEIEGAVVPPVKEYLKAAQKNGKDLCAEEVYRDTWNWLKARGCEMLVNNQLIEQYAMSVSRWIQCEEAISEFGFLAKHPTTGNAIASPYVAMSQTYMKQVMVIMPYLRNSRSSSKTGRCSAIRSVSCFPGLSKQCYSTYPHSLSARFVQSCPIVKLGGFCAFIRHF